MTAWRQRIARALIDELTAAVDRGVGESAVAAIVARPPGPARDLEVQLQARRVLREGTGTLLVQLTTDDETQALHDLLAAMAEIGQRAA